MTIKLSPLALYTAKFPTQACILTGGRAKQHSDGAKKSYRVASPTSARQMPRPAIIAVTIITLSTTTNVIVVERERKDAAGADRLISLARAVRDARPNKDALSVKVGTLSSDTNAGSPFGEANPERTILIIQ